MNVVFVCTGNTCRSPMAEAILRHKLSAKRVKAAVSSCGIAAADGDKMNPLAEEALRKNGIFTAAFKSRRLSAAVEEKADVLLCMTEEIASDAGPKALSLDALYGCGRISDPYGGTIGDYMMTYDALDTVCERIAADIADKTFKNKIKQLRPAVPKKRKT